jgi:hypothetical protein
MNERLKELAVQAGATVHKAMHGEAISFLENDLERFTELVRQDEREACAKLCDDLQLTDLAIRDWSDGTYDCANAIRARGEK